MPFRSFRYDKRFPSFVSRVFDYFIQGSLDDKRPLEGAEDGALMTYTVLAVSVAISQCEKERIATREELHAWLDEIYDWLSASDANFGFLARAAKTKYPA